MRQAVQAGRDYYDEVMEVDRSGKDRPTVLIETTLNEILARFLTRIEAKIHTSLSFVDVHSAIGFKFHTELCLVEQREGVTNLYFDASLLNAKTMYTGLIFVAKIWVLLIVLDAAVRRRSSLEGRFVFEVGDNPGLNQVSFGSKFSDACVIMDFEFAQADAYSAFRATAAGAPVWEARVPDVFWRGSTTGKRLYDPDPTNPDDLDWLPRLRLCKIAQHERIAKYCDVGLSQVVQISESIFSSRVAASGFMRPPVNRAEYLNHRMVIDIDGNANSWSGLFQSLLGGSCVLKVASTEGYRQWYYPRLEPWLHYIPIAADLSDLPHIVECCIFNEEMCKLVGQRGRSLALNLTFEDALQSSALNLLSWLLVPKPIRVGEQKPGRV